MRRIFSLLVLGAVLVAADRGAAWLADRLVANRIQQAANLSSPPTVDIGGFPFLLELAQGRYSTVRIDAPGTAKVHGVRVDHFQGVLKGVRAPLSDVVNSAQGTSLPVDEANVTGHITYAELDALLNARVAGSGLTLHLSEGTPGQLALAADLATPLGKVTVQAHTHVSVTAGRLRLSLQPEDLRGVPGLARGVLAQALPTAIPLPALPLGFTVTAASLDRTGVTLTAQAQHTSVALG